MNKLLMTIMLVLFGNVAWAAPDLNKAAKDVCDCLKAPYAQIEQAKKLINAAQASGDMSALVTAQGEMMGVIGASGRCFESLTKKYPEINQDQQLQQQVMGIADKQCPNPAASMFSGR